MSPIYCYKCDDCGHVFEALERVSDPIFRACTECGHIAHRTITSPARVEVVVPTRPSTEEG